MGRATLRGIIWSLARDRLTATPATELGTLWRVEPDCELAVFAYAHGKPAGFYVNILEINQVLKDFDGKLGWWNGLKLLMRRRKLNKARGIICGVVTAFQNLGLESGMIRK